MGIEKELTAVLLIHWLITGKDSSQENIIIVSRSYEVNRFHRQSVYLSSILHE